ncbi:MAG: efflux RND transporter periplasmic adaptor subunit [Devosia sp.]
MKNIAIPLALLLLASATPFSAMAQPAGGPPPGMGSMGPAEVGVVTLQPESAPITTVLPGRVIASATADVRPQVGGIVTEVLIKEGQSIAAGDIIAKVDSSTYEADVAVAEASLASAQAQQPPAQAKVDRYVALVESGGISQAELDTAQLDLAQAKASVASAEAQLKVANLTLERSTVTAPISGIVGAINVQVGSLLTGNQADPLTTIRQIDPVDVSLVESSSNLLTSRQAIGGGEPAADGSVSPHVAVTLALEDGSEYDQVGTISTMDLVVSETTGTFTLHASMPNPRRILLPGMFVRATIDFGKQDGVYLVPQRAVTFNPDGNPVAYFVGAENKVVQHVLTAERVINNAWVVTAGIEPGDQLIVDGLQKIQVGSDVKPLEVTIEADGVVYQDAPKSLPKGGEMPSGAPPSELTPPGDGAASGQASDAGSAATTEPAVQEAK